MEEERCGNCKWHLKDDILDEWYCDNHDGEYFGSETYYEDRYPDWEARNENT